MRYSNIVRILARDPSTPDNQGTRQIVAEICLELADIYLNSIKDTDQAISSYNEALQYDPSSKIAMLALVKLHMSRLDLSSAQTLCSTMIRMDVNVVEATLIIADILFRNNSFDSALAHYKDMLERVPSNYDALCQLIDMLKRNGSLSEAQTFFSIVERNDICKQHAGYHYCKGLVNWFNNNPNAALEEFNRCRRDSKWGERAVYNMIEIFLNPENETIGIILRLIESRR